MSSGEEAKGPWNQGQGPWPKGTEWINIEDPVSHVRETNGLIDRRVEGTNLTAENSKSLELDLSKKRSTKIKSASSEGKQQWSSYR
jgi:Mn-containing catalase